MVKLSNCGHDENGGITGGIPGDQTGTEWQVINYYTPSYGWSYCIRWKDANLAKLYANLAVEAANNDKIGYCQAHRSSFWTKLKKAGYRPGNISDACETDCSGGVIALVKAVGYLQKKEPLQKLSATYTGNMVAGFKALKDYFEFVNPNDVKLVGDIMLTPGHHTATVVDVDNKTKTPENRLQPAYNFDKKLAGTYQVSTNGTNLMLRSGAGTGYQILKKIADKTKVVCYGYYNKSGTTNWLYVVANGTTGYMSSDYLVKIGR